MKLDGDHRMEAIVRSTIELAKALDLNVVAEGVEDAAALGVLRHLGCAVAQGYHIARPLTPEGLIRFVAARSSAQIAVDAQGNDTVTTSPPVDWGITVSAPS